MMIEPPIDKLVEKIGCKYALVCLITKRTRFMLDKKPEVVEDSGETAVTYVAKEVYEGKVKLAYEE